MSFEINPVLAGTFDAPGYAPANNYASATSAAGVDDASGPDPRRYTKFDRSDTEAGSTTSFSFSDLLDALNPLQHIPVVSSIYRAVTGDTINPVARVTGDILYGAAFGGASAVLSGLGAVADAGLEAATGKDSGGLAMAALFGPGGEDKNAVQLADAGNAAATVPAPAAQAPASSGNKTTVQTIELAQAATPAPMLAALAVPANGEAPQAHTQDTPPAMPAQTLVTAAPAATATAAASSSPAATDAVASAGAIPVAAAKPSASGKLPYGGVMGPVNTQAQDMALALSQGAPGMRMGHTIYTGRLINGQHPPPPVLSSGAAAPAVPTAAVVAPPPVLPTTGFTSSSISNAPTSANTPGAMSVAGLRNGAAAGSSASLPPELMQDMMLKALSQYGHVASGPSGPGSMLNVIN